MDIQLILPITGIIFKEHMDIYGKDQLYCFYTEQFVKHKLELPVFSWQQ